MTGDRWRVTPRMIEAMRTLALAPKEGWTPSAFATAFWGREKNWARGNGPRGLGPDSSGLHGGRMLNRLHKAGLAEFRHEHGYYLASLSSAGRQILTEGENE